jgi:hypothetical protein
VRAPAACPNRWPVRLSAAALLQVGDEPLGVGCAGGAAGPDLLMVVQGGAGIQQGVTDAAVPGEEQRDVVANLPGRIYVFPRFEVLDGLLVVAQRLASVTGPTVDVAELALGDGAGLVVAGRGETEGLLSYYSQPEPSALLRNVSAVDARERSQARRTMLPTLHSLLRARLPRSIGAEHLPWGPSLSKERAVLTR